MSKAHLTNLNLNNFKIIEAIGLKITASRSLEWHHLVPNFMKINEAYQKLLVGYTQTDILE
jgi:hypothetical protein